MGTVNEKANGFRPFRGQITSNLSLSCDVISKKQQLAGPRANSLWDTSIYLASVLHKIGLWGRSDNGMCRWEMEIYCIPDSFMLSTNPKPRKIWLSYKFSSEKNTLLQGRWHEVDIFRRFTLDQRIENKAYFVFTYTYRKQNMYWFSSWRGSHVPKTERESITLVFN